MPWVILAVVVLGGLYLLNQQKPGPSPNPQPTPPPLPPGPQPAPQPAPQPTPPAPQPTPSGGGTITPSSDGMGNSVVTVAPGDMGTLSMLSAASAATESLTSGSPVTPPSLAVSAPSGAGGVTSVSSSNLAVLAGSSLSPANLGQPLPGIMLGPPLTPGQTVLSVSWNDASGNAQASTIHLTAT